MRKQKMTRRNFISTIGLAAGTCGIVRGAFGKENPAKRPNIVFVLTDDQRWDALGCMGVWPIETPNLDALASEGVLFRNNFCTTSICMSSRASFLTGLYMRSHGVDLFSKPLPPERFVKTFPALMRANGYRTAFIGKWGMGSILPESEYDYFDGFPDQGQYFHDINGEQAHLTSIMGDKSLEFLQTCSGDGPFCLQISTKAPHVQDQDPRQFLPDPKYDALYTDTVMPVPETANDEDFHGRPAFIKDSEGRARWEKRFATPEKFQQSVKGYFRLINGVDDLMGRIRSQLQEQGLAENTIIIFTSDNGFFLGEHGMAGKWLMHEESIRIPLIIYDPRNKKKMQGRKRGEMTLSIDIAPTILDFAGIPSPAGMQGSSLLPLVQKRARTDWRREWFYEYSYDHGGRIAASEGIRNERWKYVRYQKHAAPYEELYDLKKDPCEKENLALSPEHEGTLKVMRDRWRAWTDKLGKWDPDGSTKWSDPQ